MKYLSLFITILLIQVIFSGSSNALVINENSEQENDVNIYFLPKNLIPQSYIIRIEPQFDKNEFIGKNKMKLHVKIATNKIVFHCGKNINITSHSITNNRESVLSITSYNYNKETEQYTIVVNDTMPASSITDLLINYNGILSSDMKGIYISSHWRYANIFMRNETQIPIFGTHFQPTYARYAFPCFDEPHYKTIFTIIIRRPKSFLSLCNLPLIGTTSVDNITSSDVYESEIPISTYQISFFVLEFTCTYETKTIGVCTQPQNSDHTSLALHVGKKARSFLSSLFNENSKFLSVTMIGIPNKIPEITASFSLLTFSENRFLYDPIFTSDIDYEKIVTTIIRGWASMWLGHIVTPEKWDYIWLNEGVATYLSYYAASETGLSSTSKQQIIIDQVHQALFEDGIGFSKPLTRNITTLEETEQVQNTIISSKGCSIVRMMHLTLGTDIFKSTLANYVTSRKYKTSTLANFWSFFQNSINRFHFKLPVNLKTIMNSWTTQPGYPVLHVNIKNNKVMLHQHTFSIHDQMSNFGDIIWWIPLTWASASNPNFENTIPKHWFHKRKEEINFNINASNWVIFNVQQTGFYRVNYDVQSWARIINKLHDENFKIIPPINRAMIIDDLFNLARAGIVPYATALEGVSYIQNVLEQEYLPIKSALNGLQYLYERFAGQEYSILFNNFFLKLILPIYNILNDLEPSEISSSTTLLQAEVYEWVCKLGYKKCHKIMLEHFNRWKENSTYAIPKNKRSLVYCIAVKHGLIEDIVNHYFDFDNLIEKSNAKEAFKCIPNKNQLTSLLESAIRDERFFYINKQQIISLFIAIAQSNYENAEYILDFISSHREGMLNYFQDQLIIADIIYAASKLLSAPYNVEKLKTFIRNNHHHFDKISNYLELTWDHITSEVTFYEENYQTIVDWIEKQEFNNSIPLLNFSAIIHFEKNKYIFKFAKNKPEDLIKALNRIQDLPTFNYHFSKIVLNFIKYLDDKFSGRYISDSFRNYVIEIITPIYNELTFEEKPYESIDDKLLRIEIVKCACLLEHTDCKQKSRQLFDNWKNNSLALLPVSLRRMILCTAIRWGNKNDWIRLWIQYKNTDISSERDVMRQALGCTQSRENLETLLIFTITDGNNIGKEESLKIFSLIYSSGLNGVEQTLDFMLKNHVNLDNYYNSEGIIKNIFKDLSYYLTTTKLLQKYIECIDAYSTRYPKIRASLQNYFIEAKTDVLQFDDISLQVFKWLCSKNFGNNNPLSKSIVPKRYDIRLITYLDLNISNFNGFVNITLNLLSDTSYLVLHVGNLTISSVTVYFINGLHAIPLKDNPLKLNYKYIIALNTTVEAGEQLLVCITYKGYFNNIPNIFYRSYFTDQNGYGHWLAATQLDKYGARELFPCLDETYFKAKFQLSVKRPDLYYSLTNMKLNLSEFVANESSVWDHYKITEPMLPSNITIVITDIKSLKNFKTNVKIWLRSHSVIGKSIYHAHPPYLPSKNDAGWLLLDFHRKGFYFVNFDLMTWKSLFKTLKRNNFGGISVNDRAQMINDLYNLAQQNYTSLDLFLTGTEYLINEKNVLPWKVFLESFCYLLNKFDNPEINNGLKIYLSQLMKSTYQYLGFESKHNENRSIKELRTLILPWVVYLNYPDFINKSITFFNKWRINADSYSLSYIPHPYEVICSVLRNGGFDEWKFVWQYTITSEDNLMKISLIRALACTYNKTALNIYLRHIFSDENWMNDGMKKLALLSLNNEMRDGFDITLDFLMNDDSKNFSWDVITTLLPRMMGYPLSASQLSKFMSFINNNNKTIRGLDSEFYEKLINLTEYAKWYKDCAANVKFWLIKKGFITNSNIPINNKKIEI